MDAGKARDEEAAQLGPDVRRRKPSSSRTSSEMPNETTENLSQGQRDASHQLRHGAGVPQARPSGTCPTCACVVDLMVPSMIGMPITLTPSAFGSTFQTGGLGVAQRGAGD